MLSGILGSAVRYQLLVKNPAEGVQLPPNRRGRRVTKSNTSEQFDQILAGIPSPYATMVYVAVYSGLRVSELIGLRWNDVGSDCLMVDECCCRGDWSAPKSEASNAAVAVQHHVIARIHALKLKTVSVRVGNAVRRYQLVKSDGPDDLVFQSVRTGTTMRDNNILTRFIKPAGPQSGPRVRELALSPNFLRRLAQTSWRRHERHTGTDATLATLHDYGYLRSGYPRVAQTSGRETAPSKLHRAVNE